MEKALILFRVLTILALCISVFATIFVILGLEDGSVSLISLGGTTSAATVDIMNARMGVSNGLATLDGSGKVPSEQLSITSVGTLTDLLVDNSSIHLGSSTYTNQLALSVAVGSGAGIDNQSGGSVALGAQSGQYSQLDNSVAVGYLAANTTQGSSCTAIGMRAGYSNQSNYATALGSESAVFNQGVKAVAVGRFAGYTGQGNNSISVGYGAGYTDQHASSIVISATGDTAVASAGVGTLVIKPIAASTEGSVPAFLKYNTTSGEITHDTTSGGGYQKYTGYFATSGGAPTVTVSSCPFQPNFMTIYLMPPDNQNRISYMTGWSDGVMVLCIGGDSLSGTSTNSSSTSYIWWRDYASNIRFSVEKPTFTSNGFSLNFYVSTFGWSFAYVLEAY
jgi:hypothetical protein